MLATVKIAPVEMWCEANLRDLEDYPQAQQLAGRSVEILADKMMFHASDCDGRAWPLSEKSYREIAKLMDYAYDDPQLWFCEHMLEMD